MTPVDAAAFVLGVLCVWLTLKQNIWCWPVGAIQPIFSGIVFFRDQLYSDTILQVIFIVLQVYGWHHWARGNRSTKELSVTISTTQSMIICILAATAVTGGWGWVMDTQTNAAVPYWDAFILGGSLVAQWLLTRKKLESWYFWIVVDIVSVVVLYEKGLFLMSALYLIFLGLATAGFFEWRKSYRLNLAGEAA